MIIYCKNTNDGLIPLYPSDFNEKKHLKIGGVYSCSIKKERNYLFLKKFFALLKLGCENSKSIDAPLEVYRKYALIKSGFYTVYATSKGSFIEADSISFANMSQEKFEEVYSKVLDFIILDTQATKEDIENNLLNFM